MSLLHVHHLPTSTTRLTLLFPPFLVFLFFSFLLRYTCATRRQITKSVYDKIKATGTLATRDLQESSVMVRKK
jgi:hypothetical protein